MTTIIALLDFSAVTDQVFETAAGLADALHGRVVLLHVVQPSRVPAAGITVLETMQLGGIAGVTALTMGIGQENANKAKEKELKKQE